MVGVGGVNGDWCRPKEKKGILPCTLDVAFEEQLVSCSRLLSLLDKVRNHLELFMLGISKQLEEDRLTRCDISACGLDAL